MPPIALSHCLETLPDQVFMMVKVSMGEKIKATFSKSTSCYCIFKPFLPTTTTTAQQTWHFPLDVAIFPNSREIRLQSPETRRPRDIWNLSETHMIPTLACSKLSRPLHGLKNQIQSPYYDGQLPLRTEPWLPFRSHFSALFTLWDPTSQPNRVICDA